MGIFHDDNSTHNHTCPTPQYTDVGKESFSFAACLFTDELHRTSLYCWKHHISPIDCDFIRSFPGILMSSIVLLDLQICDTLLNTERTKAVRDMNSNLSHDDLTAA